jgi:hypothetical protein
MSANIAFGKMRINGASCNLIFGQKGPEIIVFKDTRHFFNHIVDFPLKIALAITINKTVVIFYFRPATISLNQQGLHTLDMLQEPCSNAYNGIYTHFSCIIQQPGRAFICEQSFLDKVIKFSKTW